jgi:hypothetical protein
MAQEPAAGPGSATDVAPAPSESSTPAGASERPSWRSHALPRLVLPVVAVALFLGLVVAGVSGSSIGALDRKEDDRSLLAGTPRDIRADEYLIQTPNSVGNVRRGLDTDPWFGLVHVDQPVATLGAPSKDWSEVLRPNDWGYFIDAEHGLAWHWWFAFLAGLLGLYALLLTLVRSVPLAASLAVVGAFTPYTGWWSAPSTALLLGYASGAGAAGVLALRARRTAWAALLAVAGGLLAAALALTIYPPWIVILALVALAVVVGQAIDLRVPWRRLLVVGGAAAVSAGGPLGVWYLQHRDAISAIGHTVYPGLRRTDAGQAWLSNILDAPLNPWLAGDAGRTLAPAPGATGYGSYVNLSEASSSWFPVGVLVAALVIVGAALVRDRRSRSADVEATAEDGGEPPVTATFWCVAAVAVLITSWALLPLPSFIGRVTLLDRVPGYRTPIALSLCAVLLVALAGELLRRRRLGRWPAVLLVVGVAVTGAATVWSATKLQWNQDLVSLPLALLSGLALGAGFAVIASGRWRTPAAALLAVYCAASWALVNPLYSGLGPLQDDAIVKAMSAVERQDPGTVVAVYGDYPLGALVAASGAQNLSGTTFYPDPAVMRRLAPTQANLWNNYASYRWVARPGEPATIRQVRGTRMDLLIDPCAPETLSLGMTWTVSLEPIHASCLQPVDTVDSQAVGRVYRYRVQR